MRRSTSRSFVLGVVVSAAGSSFGQTGSGGTITDGDATFTQSDSPTLVNAIPTATNVLRADGAAGTDHLYYNWWWFRNNASGTSESDCFNASGWSWSGNTGHINYTFPGFLAVLAWTVHDTGLNTMQVDTTMRVTNIGITPLSLSLFHGIDIDYGGTTANDSVSLLMPNVMSISDSSAAAPWNALNAFYAATNPDGYTAAAFGNAAAPRTLLTNAIVDTWTNTGLPFGPGDFTGSWQFNRTVPVDGSVEVTASFGIGAYVPPGGNRCPADLDNDGKFANGGAPDGAVTIEDLLYFLVGFEAGNVAVDLDNGTGTGTHDGAVTIEDLLFFLAHFEAGC